MPFPTWIQEFPSSITLCDPEGIVLDMNEHAEQSYAAEGGRALIGTNMLGCHPEPARSKLVGLLQNRQQNIYTIEKSGVKKLVYQSPWYEGGEYRGFMELILEIPFEMHHFIRK